MKLKHIIKYLDKMAEITIYNADHPEDETSELKCAVFEVPWTYLDAELANDENYEAISIDQNGFIFNLKGL